MSTGYPTENVCSLPGGLMLQQGQVLQQASLRPLSGREEEWLAQHPQTPNAVRVSWLLEKCLVALDDRPASSDIVREMLVADRHFLVLQLRRLALGDRVQAVVPCLVCGQKMDVDFHLDEVPVERRPQTVSSYSVNICTRTVKFRLPTGRDQEAILGAANPVEMLLERCILEPGSDTPLTEEERDKVVAEMERVAPQVELELDLTCPECAHHFLLPFDTTTFFLEEMALKGSELLHEVHAIAFYYHWSESEILSLERRRRRAYLALLNDAVRQG